MIIRKEDLQELCSKISSAVDNSDLAPITQSLSLKGVGNYLYASVTNREYYAQAKVDMGEPVHFDATVNAELFTKFVSKVTSDTLEIAVTPNSLDITANGKYKIPLIFNGNTMLDIPEISIDNKITEFDISYDVLKSILTYNSKELTKGVISKPVQKMYYVDELGAITFTTGACVNSFVLDKPVKVLFNARLVKLFKLFSDSKIHFVYGEDEIIDGIVQSKVSFENDSFKVTAILSCDDSLLASVPVQAIRNRANSTYANTIEIEKDVLQECLDRLLIFYNFNTAKPYSTFEFTADSVIVHGNNDTQETLYYKTNSNDISYKAILDLNDLKATVDTCVEPTVFLHFGNSQAVVLEHGNIKNVIPEVKSN